MDDATNSAATATADSGQSGAEVATTGDTSIETTGLLGTEGETGSDTTTETADTETLEDLYELEWDDGQKYKIPAVLKDGILRQADYTRKTQEAADLRRNYEAKLQEHEGREKTFAAEQKRREDTFKDVSEVMKIDFRIEQLTENIARYDKVDWAKLYQEDPNQANLYRLQREQLKEQRDDLARQRGEKERAINERWDKANRDAAEKAKQSQANAHEVLSKAIPKWSPETSKQITDYSVKNFGLTAQELAGVTDPRFVVVLHYARLGKMAEQKLRNPTPANPGTQKPITSVAGNKSSKAAVPRDDMPIEDWVKAERKRMESKGLLS